MWGVMFCSLNLFCVKNRDGGKGGYVRKDEEKLGSDSFFDLLINFLSMNDTQDMNLITKYFEDNAVVSYP